MMIYLESSFNHYCHIMFSVEPSKKKKKLTAISFLNSNQARQKYECGLCFEVCVKPVVCKGTCKRLYCMLCVSDWRQVHDICPVKCSTPFFVERLSNITLSFFCPYSIEDCKIPISSVDDFESHHKICPFVSPEEKHLRLLKQEYRCLKGHQLQFFIGSYHQMLQSHCQECQQKRLCRSICRVCDQMYCVTCRIPPCSKQGCPIGHEYNYQRIANLNYICDLCGISTSVSNNGVYDDPSCNFGLCEDCYATLPEKFDGSKPKYIIENVNTRCVCGGDLMGINSIHKIHHCELCKRNKECPKQCKDCRKYFCLKCKNIDIENDDCCVLHDHKFVELQMNKYPPEVQIQNELGCMICLSQTNNYYFDIKCRVRVCGHCFKNLKQATTDRKRAIIVMCDLNHVLTYISGSTDHIDICTECQKQKIIKLRCYLCQNENQQKPTIKNYCFECRPIRLETCFYKHKLKLAQFQGYRDCQICCKEYNVFHYCRKCFFYVCQGCMERNKKQFEPQNVMEVEMEEESSSNHECSVTLKQKVVKREPEKMQEEVSDIKVQ